MVTYAGGMHGNNLRIAGQFTGKEDNGNENDQRTEHFHIIGQEWNVVINNNLF